MVYFRSFLAPALFASLVAAIPMPDSAIGNEVAVSAPNGTPMSDTSMPMATGSSGGSGSSYGGSSGGSDSSYGGSSGGCSGDSCGSDKSSMGDKMDSSSKMMDSSSTMMESATSTASYSYSTPSYGSGGSSWGGSGYDSCVQQCMASYGDMGSMMMPSATSDSSKSGSGATHTVIVAPSQGVLRYVPFAVNASVGDTVMFMWGANNHTVTKSSSLEPCNKTSDALFASGTQNKDFMFSQVVNDTNPTFFYCATPGHCAKGMFGVINPPSIDNNAASSAMMMMPQMMMNSSDMSAMGSYTKMKTMNNSMAANWGMNMDMSKVPQWAQQSMAENIMYTQTFLASNPEVMGSDGTVDMGKIGASGNPAMIPMDVTQALNNAGSSNSSSSSSSAATTATASASAGASSASSSASPAGAVKTNGARSLGSSGALVAVVAVLATVLAL